MDACPYACMTFKEQDVIDLSAFRHLKCHTLNVLVLQAEKVCFNLLPAISDAQVFSFLN